MQHVNVCLQALLKRLRKTCREQEREKDGGRGRWVYGEKHWRIEKEGVPVLSVTAPAGALQPALRTNSKEHNTSSSHYPVFPVQPAPISQALVHAIQSIRHG